MTIEKENTNKDKRYFYLFIISVLSVSIIVLVFLLVNMANTAESLSISLVGKTTNEAKNEMDNYFAQISRNLIATKELCDQGVLDATQSKEANTYYLPVFNTYPEINTIVVANTEGTEYSMIREDSTWLSNVVFESPDSGMVIKRERWKGNILEKKIIREWIDYNSDYDPRTRPWFIGAIKTEYPNEPWWTDPYLFFTHQVPGITASMRSYCPNTNKTNIIEYDILLSEISEYTTSNHVSKNSKTFVLTHDLKVIGLPNEASFTNVDSLSKYILKPYDTIGSEVLELSVNKWKQLGDNYIDAYSLDINGEKWWVKITPFQLGKNKTFLIGVAVPENDFLAELNSTRNVVIGGFLIVFIIIIIVIRQYMMKRKMNLLLAKQKEQIGQQRDELHKQHEELEETHKEISDSIKYAERLQLAILPSKEELNQELKNGFVLFQPKDVVSGDFYWLEKVNETVLFAAADCTGHGVPGAMVSVVCSNAMNRSVNEFNLLAPSKILDKTRELVIETFAKSGENIKDGMDIAFCSITDMKLIYAGANNPLWIVRKTELLSNTQKEERSTVLGENVSLIEYKASKQPIGLYEEMKDFSQLEIELYEGDTIYIFTDGFADQFGGPKGKKLKYKPFKKMLLNLNEVSMNDQREQLISNFANWKGDAEQIDDVCIIGVKI